MIDRNESMKQLMKAFLVPKSERFQFGGETMNEEAFLRKVASVPLAAQIRSHLETSPTVLPLTRTSRVVKFM